MNEKEAAVARYKSWVREAEAKVQKARLDLQHGYRALNATLDRAKADHEQGYAELKHAVALAESYLERERIGLAAAEAELARGFEA